MLRSRRDEGAGAAPCRAASRSGCRARRRAPPCRAVEPRDRPGLPVHRDRRDRSALASLPARRSSFFSQSSGIHSGCSITARYMSATQRAPSGPVLSIVGRNQLSVEARNSRARSLGTATAAEGQAVGLEHHPMDQVMDRLADEQAGVEPRAEQVVAIRRRAVGRRDVVGRARVVEPGERPADRDRGACRARGCFGSGAA